jgi:hypothetical protein
VLLEIRFEQLAGSLVYLGVAFDGGEANCLHVFKMPDGSATLQHAVRRTLYAGWRVFATWFGDLLDECAFRIGLAVAVLLGRVPRQVERRRWNRAVETPILVDCLDWTSGRLLFSVLVLPSLEDKDPVAQLERLRQLKEALARGPPR